MNKKWFQSKNGHIYNLFLYDSFWIEFLPPEQKFGVFCTIENTYNGANDLGLFTSRSEAENYLNDIFKILNECSHETK